MNDIYLSFLNYYGDLKLKRIKSHDHDTFACKVLNYTNMEKYIFVHCEKKSLPEQCNLSDLQWFSLQTIMTDSYYDCPIEYSLRITPRTKKYMMDDLILISRQSIASTYSTDMPINVIVLHNKTRDIDQYPTRWPLYMALETYHCIVELL